MGDEQDRVPLSRSMFTILKSRSTSVAVNAAVARPYHDPASAATAFTISTSCWSAIDSPSASRSGLSVTPSDSKRRAPRGAFGAHPPSGQSEVADGT